MNLSFYPFKFWKFNSIVFKVNFNVIISTVCGISFPIIFLTFKFRITRMFFEEFLICTIHIKYCVVKSKFVNFFKPYIFFLQNLCTICIAIKFTHRFLFCFIKIFSISKCLIINKPTTTKCFLYLYFLCFIWI